MKRQVRWPRSVTWLLALLAGSLVGIGLRMLFFFGSAIVVPAAAALLLSVLAPDPWADPVYTHATLRSLAELHVKGIAFGGPAGARIALQPGSSLLGRLVASAAGHAATLGVGVLVVALGWRRRKSALLLAGLAIQAQVALGVLFARPTLRELEATGLAFAANAAMPSLWQRGQAVGDSLGGMPAAALAAFLVGAALLHGYLPAWLLIAWRGRARLVTFACGSAVVLISGASAAALAAATPPPPLQPAVTLEMPAPEHLSLALASDRWFEQQPVRTTVVEIVGSNYDYQLLVNGHPLVIKGMGLNTQYSYELSTDERAARLESDMVALHQLGVNTVLGWDPAEFDTMLLDAAERHDIGVVLPFDLDPEADYTDPALREQLRSQVLEWVTRYRYHPALRMWGLGNEVLHKIVHPAWVGPQDPRREANAEAFSDWLVSTTDAIHALDPDHPVTYRSAEDAFVPWIADALRRAGGGPRPWFAIGTNCYQDYLAQIMAKWPTEGLDAPLWVSEFAPGTMAIPDRPDGFATMWGYVRAYPRWVLGGAVYAWTRNGPEGVDRNFGLTDDGVPVDGRSLDMLASLFKVDE